MKACALQEHGAKLKEDVMFSTLVCSESRDKVMDKLIVWG